MEHLKTSALSGREVAQIVSNSYQMFINKVSAEHQHITSMNIDKATLAGMKECLLGNKEPDDFYGVQKQVRLY